MARISFSPLVEEIVGKLAGSVFQDSYGGYQVRTRVTPRNPQSTYQQLRRGEFGFLSASWRGLSSTERQTFIDNAASPGAALNLFLQANVNLTLIEEPVITTYVPSSDPGTMQLEFVEATPSELSVKATGSPLVVPAGTKLLTQVTYQKLPTKIFTNPSNYSPIISFDEGTDLTAPVNILTEWKNRYGVFLPDKRLCLKSALIDKSNGVRGADLINCINSEEMAKFVRIFTNVTPAASSGTGLTSIFSFNIPAGTFTQDGDTVIAFISGHCSGSITNRVVQFFFDALGMTGDTQTTSGPWQAIVKIIRVGSATVEMTYYAYASNGAAIVFQQNQPFVNFANAIATEWKIQAPISGTVTADYCYMNKELI